MYVYVCVYFVIYAYIVFFFFIQIYSSYFSFLLARTVSGAPLLDEFWFNLEATLHALHAALAHGDH